MLFNKKAELGNQMMSLIYVFLMVIIAIGLTAGIFIFFGAEYQFKQIDADSMYLKVVDCLRNNPIDVVSSAFYSTCNINEKVTKEFFRVKICADSDDCIVEESSDKIEFVEGSDFQSCEFVGVKGNDNFPRCTKGIIEKEGIKYEIVAGSRQLLRRAA